MNKNNKQIKFKVGHLNTRSIVPSFVDFVNIVTENNFDVMMISESWLSENISNDFLNIDGYRLVRCDRCTGRGGGVAMYVNSKLNFEYVDVGGSQDGNIEQLWIISKLDNLTFAFGVTYRPPKGNITQFVEAIDNSLSIVVPISDKIILAGDVNIDLFNLNNQLAGLLDSYDFCQVIDQPTHVTDHSATLLDPIFISDADMVVNAGTFNADHISNHSGVFCNLNIRVPRFKQKMYTY